MIEILCVVDLHAVGWGEIPRALVTPIKKPLQFLKRSLFKNSAFMEQIATTSQEMMLYSQVDFSLSQKWSLSLSFSSLLRRQCDHIGRFLEVLGYKFYLKSSLKLGDYFCYFEKCYSLNKASWVTCGNNWATFYLSIWSPCPSVSRQRFISLSRSHSHPITLSFNRRCLLITLKIKHEEIQLSSTRIDLQSSVCVCLCKQ